MIKANNAIYENADRQSVTHPIWDTAFTMKRIITYEARQANTGLRKIFVMTRLDEIFNS